MGSALRDSVMPERGLDLSINGGIVSAYKGRDHGSPGYASGTLSMHPYGP